MKIRKTRIKKSTKANGAVYFTAEFKWGFWWYQFNDMMAPVEEPSHICYDWIKSKEDIDHSEQQAKELIDYYISRMKHKAACATENEIVKVEHERYP